MRIVTLDIETSPLVGYAWGVYEVNLIEVIEQSYILSFAYKALGGKTECHAISDFPNYKAGDDDSQLLPILWKVLDQADIVIGQNLDKFDIPKINTRFIMKGLPPPSPYRTIDTLKISRKHFGFPSNKLNDVCTALGIGQKLTHTGFDLWKKCMAGDLEAWELMKEYNSKDVDLTEETYIRQRAWIKNHPNTSEEGKCPRCEGSEFEKRGFAYTKTQKFQKKRCLGCNGWSTDRKALLRVSELNSA